MFERRAKKQNLPMICSRTKSKHIECHFDKQDKNDMVFAVSLLHDAEQAKRGTIDWLIGNNVVINIDYTIDAKGLAKCFSSDMMLYIHPEADVGTLMHEFAHCKEGYARHKKGMSMLWQGKTGDWEKIDETHYMPSGHEVRAEHFRQRLAVPQNPKIDRVPR